MSDFPAMELNETDHYEEHGYCPVRGAAPPEVVHNLLSLIRAQMTAKPEVLQRFLNKPAVNTKPAYEFYSYHHPTVMGFHWGLTSRMVQLTKKRLAPSYAYFRVYQQGDVCQIHTDRQSCEHSFSMSLGYADEIVWPFQVGVKKYDFETASQLQVTDDFGDEASKDVMLKPGDAILYKGCNYRHGRVAPNPNRWSAHCFLHWIDLDGPFKEWAFDRQNFPPMGDFPFPDKPAVSA